MPELPEVETIARTLAPQVVGRSVLAVHVLHAKTLEAGKDLLAGAFPGARITGVRRRAKLLLIDLAAGAGDVPPSATGAPGTPVTTGVSEAGAAAYTLAFHLKMTGRLFVHGPDAMPHKHTRMVFDLAEAAGKAGAGNAFPADSPAARLNASWADCPPLHPSARLFFDDVRTFGYCRLLRPEDFAQWAFWRKLGPEPLTLKAEDFVACLHGRRGAIKALLLDQTVIAGIGNIYADEACFRAGVRPDAPAFVISPARLTALLGHIKDVLNESIAECGSSIRDYRDAKGDAGAFQNLFRVYGRAGLPCLTCGETLRKITVAGRTTVFCNHCQRT